MHIGNGYADQMESEITSVLDKMALDPEIQESHFI